MICWSNARGGRSRADSSIFRGSDVVHDLRWATALCVDGVVAAGVHDLRKFVGSGIVAVCKDDESDDSGFHRPVTGDGRLDGLSFPTSGTVDPTAAASRALLAFTIDCTNPRPLSRLILGVGSFSIGGWREGVRRCGVCGIALGVETSGRGRDGVGAENVGSLTLNAGDDVLAAGDFLGVVNVGVDNLEEGSVGDFAMGGLLSKAAGGERTSRFGLREGTRKRGETGRDCDCNAGGGSVAVRVGWVPVGVLTVRDRGTSRSREGLLAGVDATCSTCCTYRLSAVDGVLVRG